MKIINGENLVLGRAASHVAKLALMGDEVALINCEKLMVTGNKSYIMAHQMFLADLKGKPNRGRFYHTLPPHFVQRVIRGMLPKNAHGIAALKRVRCYISTPNHLKAQASETLDDANVSKVPHLKYMSIAEICRLMGGRWMETK